MPGRKWPRGIGRGIKTAVQTEGRELAGPPRAVSNERSYETVVGVGPRAAKGPGFPELSRVAAGIVDCGLICCA